MATRIISVTIAIAWLLVPWSSAQRLQTHIYSEMDGLPISRVRSIVQADDGRMWFATRKGVAVYDGLTWELHGTEQGLSHEDLRWLTIAEDGAVWALRKGACLGVARWGGEGWQEMAPMFESGGEASGFEIDVRTGQIFVGTSDGLLRFDGHEWVNVAGSTNAVLALESQGRHLLVGDRNGLHRLAIDDPSHGLVKDGEIDKAVCGLHVEGERVCMVGADWVGWLAEGTYHLFADALDLAPMRILPLGDRSSIQFEPDGAGGFLLASPNSVGWLAPDQEILWIDRSHGLAAIGAFDIHLDREGNIWLAGRRGVTKIIGRQFETLDSENGLFADEVTSVHQRPSGVIVLGHPGGLTFMQPELRTRSVPGGVSMGRVMDIEESSDGTLFVATAESGLLEISPTGVETWHRLSTRMIGCLLLVGDILYCGTHGRLILLERKNDVWEVVEPLDIGMDQAVRRLALGQDGSIFIGTAERGVVRLSPDGGYTHYTSEVLGQNSVYAVHEKPDGTLWVGTEMGLMEVADGKLRSVERPAIERSIYFITPASDGSYWLGTDGGAAHWGAERLDWYGPSQGLVGFETNRDAGFIDKDARVWIGTDRGVSVFDSAYARGSRAGPTVALTEIEAGEELVRVQAGLSDIRSNGPTLAFRFKAISFVDERRIRFRHRLEGLNADWVGPVHLGAYEVRFVSLPPGRYRFHIEAIDVNDRVSPLAMSPWIEIPRPLSQNPWIITAAVGLTFAFIWIFVARANARSYARKLEREVEQRSQQLAQSERELAEDRERLSVAMSSITEGVAATNAEGRVFLWNRAASELTGRGTDVAIGQTLDQAIGVPGDKALQRMLASVLEGNEEHVGETRLEIADCERLFEFSGAPLRGGSPEIQGAVIAFRDVTQRRAWERDVASTQRLEALGLLAGGIAHDFNNYLTVILGTLGLVGEDPAVPRSLRERVGIAEETLKRAVSLTQQLLTFSKGGAPICKPVSIEDLVRETARFALSGSAVESKITIDEGLRHAEIDEGQIAEVLHNLLLNARQAMPQGGCIHLALRNLAAAPRGLPAGAYVEIRVRDEGKGIPVDDLPHVFDPFFTRRQGGTGLGLAVAYSVVQRHGGRIAVESPPGGGTTFHIQLPATSESAAALKVPKPLGTRRGMRVLLMDDEPAIRKVLSAMLHHLGYEVDTVDEGLAAVASYRDAKETIHPYDVVILDLTIRGGLGGLETLERILAFDPAARAVAATGYSTDGVIGEHEKFGFKAALAKPFKIRELGATLSEVLSESQAPTG